MSTMLTTIDNPFNPIENFDEWYAFDEAKGYCTSGLLARIVETSDDLPDAEQESAIDEAIDEIIALHPDGFYKKVVE